MTSTNHDAVEQHDRWDQQFATGEVAPGQRGGNHHEQDGEDSVERGRPHPSCPRGTQPGSDKAAGQQIHGDEPLRRHG